LRRFLLSVDRKQVAQEKTSSSSSIGQDDRLPRDPHSFNDISAILTRLYRHRHRDNLAKSEVDNGGRARG